MRIKKGLELVGLKPEPETVRKEIVAEKVQQEYKIVYCSVEVILGLFRILLFDVLHSDLGFLFEGGLIRLRVLRQVLMILG